MVVTLDPHGMTPEQQGSALHAIRRPRFLVQGWTGLGQVIERIMHAVGIPPRNPRAQRAAYESFAPILACGAKILRQSRATEGKLPDESLLASRSRRGETFPQVTDLRISDDVEVVRHDGPPVARSAINDQNAVAERRLGRHGSSRPAARFGKRV
jgi:hypothetical protein